MRSLGVTLTKAAKKLCLNVYTFFHSLFRGLENANSVAFETGDPSNDSGGGIELKKMRKSVLQDLLRGVVTEEVKALRYEMYLTEQKSYDYKYVGNGVARKYSDEEVVEKKSKIASPYDGYETVCVVHNMSVDTEDPDEDNMTIRITRDGFVPRFRIERFTEKICVYRNLSGDGCRFDLHVPSYDDRVYRIMRMFINEVSSIIKSGKKTDLVDFDTVEVNTFRLKTYTMSGISFIEVEETDGYFIFKFTTASMTETDLPTKYYHEETHKKFEEKAPRCESTTISFEDAAKKVNEEYEYEREADVLEDFGIIQKEGQS